MLWKIIFLVVSINVIVHGQKPQNIDSLINEIFGITATSNVTVPSEPSCECVPYYLCNSGVDDVSSIGIIDIRLNETGSTCESYVEICCSPEGIIREPTLTTTITSITEDQNCGKTKSIGVGLRVKDDEVMTNFGEYPWMVAIFRKNEGGTFAEHSHVLICGGSLIRWNIVITAAHCVVARNSSAQLQLKIRAGEWDIEGDTEKYPHQERNVNEIIIHPQYKAGILRYDVALLILNTSIIESENTGLICLPRNKRKLSNTECFSSGWGKNELGQGNILKKIKLSIVDNAQCKTMLRKSDLGSIFRLHISNLCANGEESGTRHGDNGGPLICPLPDKPNRYMLSGIVGSAINFEEPNTLGIFTNVAEIKPWVETQLSSKQRSSGNNEATTNDRLVYPTS